MKPILKNFALVAVFSLMAACSRQSPQRGEPPQAKSSPAPLLLCPSALLYGSLRRLRLCNDLCIRRHPWLSEASRVVNGNFEAEDLLDAIVAEVDVFRCK